MCWSIRSSQTSFASGKWIYLYLPLGLEPMFSTSCDQPEFYLGNQGCVLSLLLFCSRGLLRKRKQHNHQNQKHPAPPSPPLHHPVPPAPPTGCRASLGQRAWGVLVVREALAQAQPPDLPPASAEGWCVRCACAGTHARSAEGALSRAGESPGAVRGELPHRSRARVPRSPSTARLARPAAGQQRGTAPGSTWAPPPSTREGRLLTRRSQSGD
jgi:hypothetical protein